MDGKPDALYFLGLVDLGGFLRAIKKPALSSVSEQGWHRLHATVPLDRETLWWIFALNENIRLHAPQVWVDEMRERLNSMQALYQNTHATSQLQPA